MTLKKPKIYYQINNIETPQKQNSQTADMGDLDTTHNMMSFWNNIGSKIFMRASDNGYGRT